MAQQLIVEGKDSIVLTNILMKRGLTKTPPLGYSTKEKYVEEFINEAGSVSNVKFALENALNQPDISNIGVVVDANAQGFESRIQSILDKVSEVLGVDQTSFSFDDSGFVFEPIQNLKIGIWVMPNNSDEGYLEHFVSELIEPNDRTFQHAQNVVNELLQKDWCNFSEIKKQKAILHTYLAWQKSPGLPMGTAVQAGYINAISPNASNFQTWFENTFELEPIIK